MATRVHNQDKTDRAQEPKPLRRRWKLILVVVVLHLGPLLAVFPSNFTVSAVGAAIFLHCLTIGFGISLGYHRLASHRSFQVPKALEYFFILCGTLAGQGSVKGWVGYHRMHHLYVDSLKDPHDSTQGFWWSHINWVLHENPSHGKLANFTKDIANDPFYEFCHQHYLTLQIALAVLLYGLGGMPFLVWGTFVRLFVGFHTTFFVNSVCHTFGYRNFDLSDRSTNCWWVALLSFGEGWHNNHHAAQSSAKFSKHWWEIDLVWQIIRTLEKLGIAKNVRRVASPFSIQ